MFRPDLYMRTIGPMDWAFIPWSLVNRGLLAGVVGPDPMVPTMPPFFLLERVVIPGGKKKTCLTGMGNNGQSMLVCSNVNFLIFWIRICCDHLGYP